MKQDGTNTPYREPLISWEEDFNSNSFFCKLRIPHSWLKEASHIKRQLQLWWWLTILVWRLPK